MPARDQRHKVSEVNFIGLRLQRSGRTAPHTPGDHRRRRRRLSHQQCRERLLLPGWRGRCRPKHAVSAPQRRPTSTSAACRTRVRTLVRAALESCGGRALGTASIERARRYRQPARCLTPRPASASRTEITTVMQIQHANNDGIHDGSIMRVVDEAGRIAAMRHAPKARRSPPPRWTTQAASCVHR